MAIENIYCIFFCSVKKQDVSSLSLLCICACTYSCTEHLTYMLLLVIWLGGRRKRAIRIEQLPATQLSLTRSFFPLNIFLHRLWSDPANFQLQFSFVIISPIPHNPLPTLRLDIYSAMVLNITSFQHFGKEQ